MSKKSLLLGLVILMVLTTSVFANPYASQLSAPATFVPGTNCDIKFFLNDYSKNTTLEIFDESTLAVVKTFNLGALNVGQHTVSWNGKDNSNADLPAGNYKFTVKAESDGYSAWTNITPKQVVVNEVWTTDSLSVLGWPVVGVANGANNIRGIGYNGTNLIITSTSSGGRKISVVGTSRGEYITELSQIINDPFDADNDSYTTDTFNYGDGVWANGMYDIAQTSDNRVFVGSINNKVVFPITEITSDAPMANPRAVAMQTDTGSRALDVVNTGVNMIMYQVESLAGGPIRIFTTADGNKFSLLETIPSASFGTPANNNTTVIGKEGNSNVNGDVIWVGMNTSFRKYVKTSSGWVQDTTFAPSTGAIHGDYLKLGNYEYLVIGYITGVSPWNSRIDVLDANTGAVVAAYHPDILRTFNDGMMDLCIVKQSETAADIYFGHSEPAKIGKLALSLVEVGSAQYDSPNGVAVFKNQENANFGLVAVANGNAAVSTNMYAEADKKGLYILNPDFSYNGGTVASSYNKAQNDALAPWDPSDWMSPWNVKLGRDDSKLYLGDSGSVAITDNVYAYDLTNAASAILNLTTSAANWGSVSGKNHGRVVSAVSIGTGANKALIGVDRDNGGGRKIIKWAVGETSAGFSGTGEVLINAPNTGLGVTDATFISDITIDSTDTLYVVNQYSAATETCAFAVKLDGSTKTLLWKKTGADLGLGDGANPIVITVNDEKDEVYVLCYGDGGAGFVVVLNSANGNKIGQFDISAADGQSIDVDAAGNIITGNTVDDHIRMWSPAGANNFTTTYYGTLRNISSVKDWQIMK